MLMMVMKMKAVRKKYCCKKADNSHKISDTLSSEVIWLMLRTTKAKNMLAIKCLINRV